MTVYREFFLKKYEEYPLLFAMMLGLTIAFAIVIVCGIVTWGATVYYAMFPDKNDLFMDYFNSIYYSLTGPYVKHSVIYPPLITVIYEVIGEMLYLDDISSGFAIRDSYTGLFSYTIFVIISMYLLYRILKRDRQHENNWLFESVVLLLLFSYPVLFAIMRGNCIIYSMIFVELFLIGYRSENKIFRYLSYVCLGCAAGLKIYVALFGLLVIRERNVRDIIICIAIGAFVMLFPFVFTDGNILMFLENSFGYATDAYVSVPLVNISDMVSLLGVINVPSTLITAITLVLCALTYLITAYILFTKKDIKMWEMVMLLSSNVIIGFGVSSSYLFVFLLLAVPLFLLEEKEPTKINRLICVLLVYTFMLFPGFDTDFLSRGVFISLKGISVLCLYILIVINIMRRKDVKVSDQDSMTDEMGVDL